MKTSFLIAAFNEEEFIRECIDSCLAQEGADVEVVVVDDGSTDGTASIVKTFTDSRVKFVRFEKNKGKVAAFNAAFAASTGEYISLVGADDVNLKSRVALSIACIEEHDVDLVFGDLEICDASLKHLGQHQADDSWDIFDLMIGNRLPGGAALFKRALAERIFPIPDGLRFEDWWIAFISCLYGRFKALRCVVAQYRQHGGNDVGAHGEPRRRRTQDWRRHANYYAEFRRYLIERPDLMPASLMRQINACYALKRLYLAEALSERIKIGVKGGLPRGVKWKIAYMATLLFGCVGYEFVLQAPRLLSGRRG